MEPQRNADRQVNAGNRLACEILRCQNHQIRLAPIEIVSIGHDIAFVFAGGARRWSKYGFARRAVLETVLLDRRLSTSCLSRTLPDVWPHPAGDWPITVAGATMSSWSCLNEVV